jgi:hypothetical protein
MGPQHLLTKVLSPLSRFLVKGDHGEEKQRVLAQLVKTFD